jgi:cell division protein FtsQ
MDGGGCVAEPVIGKARAGTVGTARRARRTRRGAASSVRRILPRTGKLGTLARRLNARADGLDAFAPPRGVGVAATALIILGSIAFGIVRGDHVDDTMLGLRQTRDTIVSGLGFGVTGVALTGNQHLSRDEIFAIAGVTAHTPLFFLDVSDARAKLKTNPWIADATVQKLYPDRLQIAITERTAFALWQKDRRISIVADDGTVLEPFIAPRYTTLPLFVGTGAAERAKEFLALLDRYPDIRDQVRASVLVAERRWNLRLKNGIDVRLPEFDVAAALDRLVALDKEKKLLSRDITAVDLRLADRVTVRLSDAAAQARDEALKAKKPKPKGGNA